MKTLSERARQITPRLHSGLWILTIGLFGWGGVGAVVGATTTSNWPQWRGPQATGVAPDGHPPVSWSENENIKWKVKLPGSGAGTPIVWGGQVFIQAAIPTGKKIEPPAEEKKAARLGVPQLVFGQAQPALNSPPPPPPPEGQRRRRPGGGGGPGGPGGGFGGRAEKPNEFHQFVLLSVNASDGKVQWQKVVREEVPHESHHRDHGFASHSPVTDGRLVFGWFGSRGLHCFDLQGNLKWQKDLGKLKTANAFGEGSSPAIHGNTIVVNWDHEGEDFIAAFDTTTGKELWRNPREEKTTWTSPLIVEHQGKAQVIVAATQRIRSYDLATGKQIWECGGMTANVIPTPVSGFGMLYAISGFRGNSLLAIQLGRTGDLTDSDAIAWRYGKSTPYVPSPALVGERLYFLSGNNPVLSCFQAKTGKELFTEQRLEGPSGFYASVVAAAGKVYLAGRNGTTVVIKDSDTFEVLATNKLEDKFEASPAIVGNDLFLRGHEFLYCISSAK